jgi:MFS family permease
LLASNHQPDTIVSPPLRSPGGDKRLLSTSPQSQPGTTEGPSASAVAVSVPGPSQADRPGWFEYFSPRNFNVMARPSYRIELLTVFFFSMTLAAVDNSFVSVFVKQTYSGTVDPLLLSIVVALVGSASEIANILSFFWVSASNGVRKVPFINALQLSVILLVATLAFIPETTPGLLVLTGIILIARVSWSGIILLRPTVWRVNYRKDRASIVGRFSSVQQFIVAVVGILLGLSLDSNPEIFHVAAPAAALFGLVALLATRQLRVRREPALLRAERNPEERRKIGRPWQGPAIVWRVLRQDRRFAQFMICMFLLGYGNIMVAPIVVIVLKDQFDFGYFKSILLMSTIPYILMPLAVPVWAKFLDRAHVVRFRAYHSWAFVGAAAFFFAGVASHQAWLLVIGSLMLAVGFGGGTIAWNLGHVDFSPPAETSQYMATHVTLNGVRGLLAPLSAVAIYEHLRSWDLSVRLSASIVLSVALVLAIAGGLGFVWLNRSMGIAGPYKRRTT